MLLWFSCFSQVMTTDQLVYLFGRIIPALALVLSMTLRFVPRFDRQLRKVSQAQQSLGQDREENGRWGQGPPGGRGPVRCGHLGPGKRRGHGRFHAVPGLRPSGSDGLFQLPAG